MVILQSEIYKTDLILQVSTPQNDQTPFCGVGAEKVKLVTFRLWG